MLASILGIICPVLFAAFFASVFGTPIFARFAAALGAVDHPGPRRIHTHPIPRTGGLAVFVGINAGLLTLLALSPCCSVTTSATFEWWLMFSLASFIVLIAGFIDDIYGLPPLSKL